MLLVGLVDADEEQLVQEVGEDVLLLSHDALHLSIGISLLPL